MFHNCEGQSHKTLSTDHIHKLSVFSFYTCIGAINILILIPIYLLAHLSEGGAVRICVDEARGCGFESRLTQQLSPFLIGVSGG